MHVPILLITFNSPDHIRRVLSAVRRYFICKYPERADIIVEQVEDAHQKNCYLAGLNMDDRKFTLETVEKAHDKAPYVHRLTRISKFPILFRIYQLYRRLTGKTRTPLQMYFGQ